MKTVAMILELAAPLQAGFLIRIENEPWMTLVIEDTQERGPNGLPAISVAHYGECGVLHDVEALEESALLMTISWPRQKSDAAESFSSTQRHLDEEAMSRMDDEGGAPVATASPSGMASNTLSGS